MPDPDPDVIELAAFGQLAPDAAAGLLLPCCASQRWAGEMAARRPYRTLAGLTAASDAVIAGLAWDDLCEALAAHPRIGGRAAGSGREAAWSAREQQAAATVTVTETGELAAANLAYEQKFGYVFLISAAGRPAADILAALRGRLGHDPLAEREVVRDELAAIARLRLARVLR